MSEEQVSALFISYSRNDSKAVRRICAGLVARSCARLTRNLGQVAWHRYIGEGAPESTCPQLPAPALE